MTRKSWAMAAVGLSIAATFIYREVSAQSCPDNPDGCIAATNVPCSSSGSCVAVPYGGTPPGGGPCDGGTSVRYWSATAPPSMWSDCISRQGQGNCPRQSQTCQTITYYQASLACTRGEDCGSFVVSACAATGSNVCVVPTGPGGS